MPSWATSFTDLLWQSAIGVVPLAIIVAAICRWGSCRPATRHVLWLGVLAWLPAGLFLPPLPFSLAGASPQTANPPLSDKLQRQTDRERTSYAPAANPPWQMSLAGGATGETPLSQPNSDLTSHDPIPQPAPAQSHPTPSITDTEPCEDVSSSADRLGLPLKSLLAQEPTKGANAIAPEEALQSLASPRHQDILTIGPTPQPAIQHSPTDTRTSAPSPLRTQLSSWLAGLAAVRDAIGRLPTFPSALWLAGIVLIMAIRVRSVIRFRNRLRSGTPAPPSVVTLVADTAAKLGLRRVPETIMVRDRISPMIWCGRKARLVLPKRLWKQLDHQGRRAVVYHELAHLRRKDHWVCWAELLVIATYWWHPLVWWVRGKMRDEAENCCDAWVTWLLPRGRRAYAEALLMTRQFAGETTAAPATPAIEMATGKTKRFARRLTMIMTQQQTPRLSTSGIVLALSLAVAGCVATPARSAEQKAPRAAEVAPPAAPVVVVAPRPQSAAVATVAPTAVITPTPPVAPLASTVVVAPRSWRRASVGPDERKLAERMERLERQLEKLAQRLERAGPRARSSKAAPPSSTWRGLIADPSSGGAASYAVVAPPAGRDIVATYKLPKGQLEALTKLMVLPDVPIRVRPREGAIEVHGTQADHDRFKAFIGLLSDEKSVEAYRLPPGKLKALTALMGRDDVPVMVQPGSDEIKVQGTPAVQAVFQAFVEMIHPEKDGRRSRVGAPRGPRARAGALRRDQEAGEKDRRAVERALAGTTRAFGRSYARIARQQAKELRKRARADVRRAIKGLSQKAKDLERQAERLEAEADRLEDRAERARDKANNLRDKARQSGKSDNADRLGAEADAIEAQADDLETQAEVLLAQAEAVQEQVEAIEEQAEEVAEQIEEQFEKVAEQIEEQVERKLEEVEEAIEADEEDHDDDDDDDDHDDDDEDDDDD